eukprot:9109565-Lingulodinium_polyedra.AAC.1
MHRTLRAAHGLWPVARGVSRLVRAVWRLAYARACSLCDVPRAVCVARCEQLGVRALAGRSIAQPFHRAARRS